MKAIELIAAEEKALSSRFSLIDETALFNQRKVLDAFREEMIAFRHFAPSTGYGYGDEEGHTRPRLCACLRDGARHRFSRAPFGHARPHRRPLRPARAF